MFIERLQVEDGFLDGLDLEFTQGLNTLIGARGTGKTSIIELLRFCFDVGGYTPESKRKSREHALSILGEGQVVVTVRDGQNPITISRSAASPVQAIIGGSDLPIIFSQTEIESVGLQPGGRLRLLDSFSAPTSTTSEDALIAQILSLTIQASSIRREIDDLQTAILEMPGIDKQLSELKPLEDGLSQISQEALTKTKATEVLTTQLSTLSVAETSLQRFRNHVERVKGALEDVVNADSRLDRWPENAGPDLIQSQRATVEALQNRLRSDLAIVETVLKESDNVSILLSQSRMPLESQSRLNRKEIEALQAGAGEISRRGQQLRERRAQLLSLQGVTAERLATLSTILQKRNQQLDALDTVRAERFVHRQTTVARLNKDLGPRIHITVQRAGQDQAYSAAIADVLKGTGIRYNELAPLVAKCISPRELLHATEGGDYDFICTATGVTKDRAIRFITALKETDIGRLGTVQVDDTVNFSLLDGKDYKDLSELSTGQRCTVILPLILRHTGRVLIVDQPEDHIDNAFITETLIKSLLSRSSHGQVIFSTHNANIPVLGHADRVIQMNSDGHRGFPLVQDDLESPKVVQAISTVMEGGAEAFRLRGMFYSGNPIDKR